MLARGSVGTGQYWHEAVLAQSSFGTRQCWHKAVLAQGSVGTKYCWQHTKAHDDLAALLEQYILDMKSKHSNLVMHPTFQQRLWRIPPQPKSVSEMYYESNNLYQVCQHYFAAKPLRVPSRTLLCANTALVRDHLCRHLVVPHHSSYHPSVSSVDRQLFNRALTPYVHTYPRTRVYAERTRLHFRPPTRPPTNTHVHRLHARMYACRHTRACACTHRRAGMHACAHKGTHTHAQELMMFGSERQLLMFDLLVYTMWDIFFDNTMYSILLTYLVDRY